jgi:uncharacterized membrane protein YkgB
MSPPKYVDLLVLAAALAVFLLGGLPMLGFAAGAGVWLVQRGIQLLAERRANRELAAGNRQRAMATVGVSTLGRVGLMAAAVLAAGIVEREAGLTSAILVAVLFTVSFAAQGISHLFNEEPEAGKA